MHFEHAHVFDLHFCIIFLLSFPRLCIIWSRFFIKPFRFYEAANMNYLRSKNELLLVKNGFIVCIAYLTCNEWIRLSLLLFINVCVPQFDDIINSCLFTIKFLKSVWREFLVAILILLTHLPYSRTMLLLWTDKKTEIQTKEREKM